MLVPHRYLRLIGAASAVSAAVAAHPDATNFSAGADFVRELKPKSSKHAKNSKKSSHDAKTSKKKKKTEKNKSACAKAIEGSWLYDCPSCECNQWLLTLSCEGDRCAYTEREHPTECGLAPRYSESWDYPCTMSGNAPAGAAGIEKGYMEFSSESISKGGGEDKIVCQLGSTTTPINLGNFGEHCTKEITASEHSYAVKAEFSSDEMHLYVSVDGGKLFTGLRIGTRFVEERLFDGPDGGRGLQNSKAIDKHCPTCNDWIPCKKDKTKTHACLKDLVAIAENGRNIVTNMSLNAAESDQALTFVQKSDKALTFVQKTIKLFAKIHPALSKSFAIATWLNSEEEKGAITKQYLTEINNEFKSIHTTLDAIDNAINEESKSKPKKIVAPFCDAESADIDTAIEQLRNIKLDYDKAVVEGDNDGRNDFIKNGCPDLERLDKSFYMLIGTLLRRKFQYLTWTTAEWCIRLEYNKAEYYRKPHTFYREIVAPLVQWIVYGLQMTAVCPGIDEGNYQLLATRSSEVIEAIKLVTNGEAKTQCSEEDVSPHPVKCPVFTKNPVNNIELQKDMLEATQPCGYYECQGCSYPVIRHNVVHPGEGPGELEYEPYIVQFDIGIHPNLEGRVDIDHNNYQHKDKRERLRKDKGEECLEIIVKGGSAATGGCAGKCGSGCNVLETAGYAKDCMKHDVCTTYKALTQLATNKSHKGLKYSFSKPDGFCYDPDCGDEAASTLHNCFINKGLFSPDKPITCEKHNMVHHSYSHWSHATGLLDEGPCWNFIYYKNGQGIPNKNMIDNPYHSDGVP